MNSLNVFALRREEGQIFLRDESETQCLLRKYCAYNYSFRYASEIPTRGQNCSLSTASVTPQKITTGGQNCSLPDTETTVESLGTINNSQSRHGNVLV